MREWHPDLPEAPESQAKLGPPGLAGCAYQDTSMLAPMRWCDTSPDHGDSAARAPRLPIAIFKAAYGELCARIWIELEFLAHAAQRIEFREPPRDIAMSAATLRLELLVLVDYCRSPYWSSILATEQRERLCSMLTDVLAALYVDPDSLTCEPIAEAQDRVLDELLMEADHRLRERTSAS